MINKRNLIMLCSVVLFHTCLLGQNDTLQLSVKEAEKYAIEHNYSMKNASIELKKAKSTQWYAISSMLPQVTGSLDYTNYLGYELNMMGMQIPMDPTSNITVQASIGVSGAQIVSATLGRMAREMAQTNYQITEHATRAQIKTIYFSILAMENTMKLLGESMENILRLETYVQQAVTVGISEQTDADQISVQVSSLQNSINSTRRSVEMLYNSLRLLLGASVNTEIRLTEGIEDILNIENANNLLNEHFSLTNNLDYQLIEQNVALAKRQVRLNEWNYGPTLSAYYQYKSKIKTTAFDMNPPQVIGITLNVPIFSSGSKLSKVNEAKCSYKSAVNNMEMVADQLKVQDRQLRYNLHSHFENYETQRKNIDVSQRVFNNITNKYEQGYASSMDVTNSSNNLITAQSNYIQAMLELINAQIELEKLLNK